MRGERQATTTLATGVLHLFALGGFALAQPTLDVLSRHPAFFVAHRSDAGDVVNVRPGYARNYLIPKGIAIPATAEKMKEVEHYRRLIEKRQVELLKDLKGASARIREMDLEFEAHAGDTGKLFGSITPAQIAAALGNGVPFILKSGDQTPLRAARLAIGR